MSHTPGHCAMGCKYVQDNTQIHGIKYVMCPMHKAAPELLEALRQIADHPEIAEIDQQHESAIWKIAQAAYPGKVEFIGLEQKPRESVHKFFRLCEYAEKIGFERFSHLVPIVNFAQADIAGEGRKSAF